MLERLERLATATPPDAEPGAPIAPVHTNVTLTKADGSVHSQCKLQVNHLETATFVDDPNLKKALVRSPPLPTPPTPLLCLSDTPSYTPTQNAVMKPVYADEKEQKMRTFYWGRRLTCLSGCVHMIPCSLVHTCWLEVGTRRRCTVLGSTFRRWWSTSGLVAPRVRKWRRRQLRSVRLSVSLSVCR